MRIFCYLTRLCCVPHAKRIREVYGVGKIHTSQRRTEIRTIVILYTFLWIDLFFQLPQPLHISAVSYLRVSSQILCLRCRAWCGRICVYVFNHFPHAETTHVHVFFRLCQCCRNRFFRHNCRICFFVIAFFVLL